MKKILLALVIVVAVLIGGYYGLDAYAHHKIQDFLEEQVEKGDLDYQDYSISLWRGDFTINKVAYKKDSSQVSADQLRVRDVGYWPYLLQDEIAVNQIELDRPIIHWRNIKKDSTSTSKKEASSDKFDKKITVSHLEINQGKLFMQQDTIPEKLKIEHFNIEFDGIAVDSESLQHKIPFTYKTYAVALEDIDYKMNNLQQLQVDRLAVSENNLAVGQLNLKPNYSRKEYIKHIPYENDLMKMSLDTLTIQDYELNLEGEHPEFTTPLMELSGIDFNIYRDKTVRDDPTKKELYSGMLRKLKLKLGIDTLKISDAKITYEEKIKADRGPGKVAFENLEATLVNVTNIDLDREDFPQTNIDISCDFMGKSPLAVNWQFKVNEPDDHFRIKGHSSRIPPESMNSFFTPAFHMKAEGSIQEIYFNFIGNANTAHGDVRLKYKGFKIEVLKKNGREKNKFLSFVANVFVNSSTKKGKEDQQVSDVQRDKTKSFWNYFWSCIFAGLKESFI